VSPLGGDLVAGLYRVGFRAVFRFDPSRTWRPTRDYKGTFAPDLNGRPVQINVWYPAVARGSMKQMRFGDYGDQNSPQAFSRSNALMKERNQRNVEDSIPSDRVPALKATQMNAYPNAPASIHNHPQRQKVVAGGILCDPALLLGECGVQTIVQERALSGSKFAHQASRCLISER
jgi:hypothetical protein